MTDIFLYRESPAPEKLKLVSGSCYLPHPAKEATGGEDGHFICVDEQAIGVADGVGGWADRSNNGFAKLLTSGCADLGRFRTFLYFYKKVHQVFCNGTILSYKLGKTKFYIVVNMFEK